MIALVPFLGALVWVVASALGLGVLVVTGWRRGHADRGVSPTPPAPPAPVAVG